MNRHSFHGWLLLALLLLGGCAPRPTALAASAPAALTSMPRPASATPTRTATLRFTPTFTATRTTTPRATATRQPTPTLPSSAYVKGMTGYGQLFALSCEARSAADWARHFKIEVHELDFLQRLPRSKNPETGFVGSLNGGWGGVPPASYGVHAGPVATVLREYGARAAAKRGLTFADLMAEIAAGRPVMLWVTGHVAPGKGQPYQVDGKTITVAPYEHTVIITGYDEKKVYILDGKNTYPRDIQTFLEAWSPLGNMAIVWEGD